MSTGVSGTWQDSGRHTSINGEVLPIFKAKAGEIERWRLIHAGVRETINLQFRPIQKKDADGNKTPSDFIKEMGAHQYLRLIT